jgi:hypothetical protein
MRVRRRALGALAAALVAGVVAPVLAPGTASAVYNQCPPVFADAGCQFLITIPAGGAPTAAQDTTQMAYENSDDSLIGVQNNSGQAISSLPLSAMSLFGFEADGICDPGGSPVPAGCQPVPGTPAGTLCTTPQGLQCSFPPPAGEPANYTEAGAASATPWPNGDRQNGYEGPTSWFSGISADTSSGTVNFSPPIPPGGSTYVSLEQPPSLAALMVGMPTPAAPPPSTKLPPAFGKNGVIGIPSAKRCLSKRHFKIHVVRRKGLTYTEAIVFVAMKQVGVIRNGPRFAAGVDLRNLPAGTFQVKITVITTSGQVIAGTRTYHTCRKRLPFLGPPKL